LLCSQDAKTLYLDLGSTSYNNHDYFVPVEEKIEVTSHGPGNSNTSHEAIDYDSKEIISELLEAANHDYQKIEINVGKNPWNVSSASEFLKYCCPECDYKALDLDNFCKHSLENHLLSKTLFSDDAVKESNEFETNQNVITKKEPESDLSTCTILVSPIEINTKETCVMEIKTDVVESHITTVDDEAKYFVEIEDTGDHNIEDHRGKYFVLD